LLPHSDSILSARSRARGHTAAVSVRRPPSHGGIFFYRRRSHLLLLTRPPPPPLPFPNHHLDGGGGGGGETLSSLRCQKGSPPPPPAGRPSSTTSSPAASSLAFLCGASMSGGGRLQRGRGGIWQVFWWRWLPSPLLFPSATTCPAVHSSLTRFRAPRGPHSVDARWKPSLERHHFALGKSASQMHSMKSHSAS